MVVPMNNIAGSGEGVGDLNTIVDDEAVDVDIVVGDRGAVDENIVDDENVQLKQCCG